MDISQKVDGVFNHYLTPFIDYVKSEEYKGLKDEELKHSFSYLEYTISARSTGLSTPESDFKNYWNKITEIRKKIADNDFGLQDVQDAAEIIFCYMGTIGSLVLSMWDWTKQGLNRQYIDIYERYGGRKNLESF